MAGVAARSGGHNRQPAEVHRLRGTWRADQHAPAKAGATGRNVEPLAPARRRRLLVGLEDAGKRLVTDLLAEYGAWSPGELALLREAAMAVDTLDAVRAAIVAEGGIATAPQRLHRAEHQANSRLLRALAQLRLEGRDEHG